MIIFLLFDQDLSLVVHHVKWFSLRPSVPLPNTVPLRHVTLRVAEEGAGLEMTAHAYGYYVDTVEPEPGQELSEGDVLPPGSR